MFITSSKSIGTFLQKIIKQRTSREKKVINTSLNCKLIDDAAFIFVLVINCINI